MVFIPPDVSSNTTVTVTVTVTALGTGTNAVDGTSDTDDDGEVFIVNFVSGLPDASAPNVTIAAVSSVDEDSTLALSASVSGGTYDALSYAWSIETGGGSIVGSGANVVFIPPDVSADTVGQVRVTVTASGTGTNAVLATFDTDTDTEVFTVNFVSGLPDASAPNVTIAAVSSVDEDSTLALSASVSGGTYDALSYAWVVVTGGGSIGGSGANVTYNPPDVSSDTSVTVRVTVTALGTGTNALELSEDTDTDTEVFTVNFVAVSVASVPTNLRANLIMANQFTTLWDPPSTFGTGTFVRYEIRYQVQGAPVGGWIARGSTESLHHHGPDVGHDIRLAGARRHDRRKRGDRDPGDDNDMNTDEFRDVLSYLGVEPPHGIWPGVRGVGPPLNPGRTMQAWEATQWNPPAQFPEFGVDPHASPKPDWATLRDTGTLLRQAAPEETLRAAIVFLEAAQLPDVLPTTRGAWHFHPWDGAKPTWGSLVAIGNRARLRLESRERIMRAYGEETIEEEILLRLRGGQTPEQDLERERLRGRYSALVAYIQSEDRTSAEIAGFDPTDDAHWTGDD